MQGLPQGLPQGLAGQVGGVTSEQARQMQQQQQQQAAQEDQRKQMLLAVLDNGARSRLSSVALVKPERARMIENQIIQMVQSGRVQGQLGEETIVEMLKQNQFSRRKKSCCKNFICAS